MKPLDFPLHVGKLIRKNAEKKGGSFSAIVYSLNQSEAKNKKYGPIRHIQFRVKSHGKGYMVHIDETPFREAGSAGDVAVTLTRAFDQECIRAGIVAASPRSQAPPDVDGFRNPRSS